MMTRMGFVVAAADNVFVVSGNFMLFFQELV